ncbi:hypothetical protein Tsubulata_048178 [Turnera subulata]|uniref:F-box domain-containing protein n=1 Tax=Turnera subulata TaxID=218843 RepID=A0A9Q0IX25_9ROSI|nr:hypothetical protein Tsubulata_048178 [Turnera subulata]
MARVKSVDVDDDERWSKLPDIILEKIVSPLDVKSMVRVSSLTKSSRRLKKLWPHFYPSIAFDCNPYSHTDCSAFLSKLRHYTMLNKLELYGSKPECCIDEIIEFATTLYVDHIAFTAGWHLRTLRLEHCSILFREDKECRSGRLDFRQGCPKLISLSLVECTFFGKVSIQKLVKMTMGPNLMINLTIVARECVRSNPRKLEIRAPGLEDFTLLHNTTYERFPYVDFPVLKHAVVDAWKPNYPQEHRRGVCLSLFTFLRGLHNAEFVSLSYSIIQKTLSMVPGILENQPPPFRRLKSFTLKLTFDKKYWKVPANMVAYLLSCSPSSAALLIA